MGRSRTSHLAVLLLSSVIHWSGCDETLGFGLNLGLGLGDGGGPCREECECYDWVSSALEEEAEETLKRFVVNCTGMKWGLFQGNAIPRDLPINTTDLVVTEYQLGALSMSSFPNHRFHPMFLSLTLQSCHITYLSSDTFQANSLTSIMNVTLTHNMLDLLAEGTFARLPYVQNISMTGNFLQKVQPAAFRNLPQAHMINLSHNCIKEIQEGTFDNLPSLEVLDLSHNWLNSVPGRDILALPSLKALHLDGNFLNCSCEMNWTVNMRSVLGESAICLYPSNLNGTALLKLTAEDFQHCLTADSNTLIISMPVIMASAVTVLVVLGSILYLYVYTRSSRTTPSPSRPSDKGTVVSIGQITFNTADILGNNNNVFKGSLKDKSGVAVKKYLQYLQPNDLKELAVLLHLSEKGPPHPNVIRYRCMEKDIDSKAVYIALELCGGNLKEAVLHPGETFHPFLTSQCCLLQIARGVEFLHKLDPKVQHRDIKPQNILWKRNSNEMRFIISDFDLSRFSDDHSSHKGRYGTVGWAAPEMWARNKGERNIAVDVFSLGCVFYYVLTRGEHPFGSLAAIQLCQNNILDKQYTCSLSGLSVHMGQFQVALAKDLVKQMIQHKAYQRPTMSVVLKHQLFWDHCDMSSVGGIRN